MNDRVERLLYYKYKHIYEETLIESAFAEVDHKGNGIRQTYLALTKSNFIICYESLPPAYYSLKRCTARVHPEIDCLELATIIPLTLCEFRSCTRNKRKFISLTVENNDFNKRFFEFGEHLMHYFYYSVWSDYVFTMNNFEENPFSESSFDSITHFSECNDVESEPDDEMKLVHKNPKFSKDLSTTDSSEQIEEGHKVQEEVNSLKRRVRKLSHNIKNQFKMMINKESPEETTHLLIENEKQRKRAGGIHSLTSLTSSKKEPVEDIYRKSSRQSTSSLSNIWF